MSVPSENQIEISEVRKGETIVAIPNLASGIVFDAKGQPVIELASPSYCVKVLYQKWKLYFYFKQYEPRAIRSVLNKIFPEQKTLKGGTVEHPLVGSATYEWGHLFSDVFIYCHGLGNQNVEFQKELFNEDAYEIAERAVRTFACGWEELNQTDGIAEEETEVDASCKSEELISALKTSALEASFIVTLSDCNQQTGKFTDFPIDVTFRIAKPSRFQKRIQEQSMKVNVAKKGVSVYKIDVDSLTLLFDELAKELSGCVVNGEECTASNKHKWIPLVPSWWKVWSVGEVCGALKNY